MSVRTVDDDLSQARANRSLLAAAGAGGLVAISLASYTRVHEPTGGSMATFGFPEVITMKAWFASAALVLVVVQLASAFGMWGQLPGLARPPAWLPFLHRWSGTTAFLFTLPVAYHCLWALGFQADSSRVVVHSLFGTAFYGAFTTKLLALRIGSAPGWALPFVGGLVASTLVIAWSTSSLWYFSTFGTGL
jgi:hypothetical protein